MARPQIQRPVCAMRSLSVVEKQNLSCPCSIRNRPVQLRPEPPRRQLESSWCHQGRLNLHPRERRKMGCCQGWSLRNSGKKFPPVPRPARLSASSRRERVLLWQGLAQTRSRSYPHVWTLKSWSAGALRASQVPTWEHEGQSLRRRLPRPRLLSFHQEPGPRLDCPLPSQMQPLPAAQIQTQKARICSLRELSLRWV